jgi:hypothetical protein
VYSPEYLQGVVVLHVISNLYSLRDDMLVWSGTSRTFDPISTEQAVGHASQAVARQIQQDRLII